MMGFFFFLEVIAKKKYLLANITKADELSNEAKRAKAGFNTEKSQ